MATAQNRQAQALGWLAALPNGVTTGQLSTSATWLALSFIPDAARTLSAVRAFVSAVAGTLASTDITCDLYDSSGAAGAPGTSIETGKLPTSTITASGWYDFTGFTTALTAGQQYWAVLKNVNAVPGTNNATFRFLFEAAPYHLLGSQPARQSWCRYLSTNSGGSWSGSANQSALRVAYADGSYDGFPMSNTAVAGVGDGVYSSRESGVKFTSPANAVLLVAGIAMFVAGKTGAPTGSPRFGLWTGSSPSNLAYTQSFPSTAITTGQWVLSYFSSTQTLQPGTVTRVTLAETAQSDASGNRWNNQEIICDTDTNSLALLPFEGTLVKTYFDGSAWTDTAGSIFGFALLLDSTGEFGAGGGTGGAVLSRAFLGMGV